MLHIELRKRMPRDRHELSLQSVLSLYRLCRDLFSATDERQSYFGAAHPELEGDANPLQNQVVDFHYLPAEQYLRIQMFEHGSAHTPIASILCRPDEITEMGRYGADNYYKTYRPYLDVISAKLEWKTVRTDAPRNLSYMDREMVPVFRNEFISGISDLMRRANEKYSKKKVGPEGQLIHTRRLMLLQQFLATSATMVGYNHHEFSLQFIQNLRDNYVHIVSFFRMVHNPSWRPSDEARWLKRFFRALDPTTDVNSEVESDLVEQWIKFCQDVQNGPGTQNTDQLNIGGWELTA